MTSPLELIVYATLRPDGAWEATSDQDELLAIIRSAADGVLVRAVRVKVEAKAPGAVKAEIISLKETGTATALPAVA